MNCLNGEKYLREAVDSVFAQTFEDWEIIFWEDVDSSDSSGDIAKSYGSKLRYFKADEKLPLYGARNRALEKARGKYIAFLDCDDIWMPHKLQLQVEAFKANKNVGLIHTNAEVLEQTGSKRILHTNVQSSGKVFKELLKDYRINLQSVFISREALNSQDYWFDESMLYSGDADLFLRIAHDWDVLYLPEVTVLYREHGSSLSATRIEVLPGENEKILTNLSKRYDGFMNNYKFEISKFRVRAQCSIGIAKWKYAGGKEARKVIIKNLSLSRAFVLLYFMSFLPFKMVNYAKNFFRKNLLRWHNQLP